MGRKESVRTRGGRRKEAPYAAFGPLAFFLPLRRRFGIEREERPSSAAIPSSRRPRKSSPMSSVNWPLRGYHHVSVGTRKS